MFLERCGRIFFTQIRPFLFFTILLLPILLTTSYLIFQHIQLQQLENHFFDTAAKGKSIIEKKSRKEKFLTRYSSADPYFINQKIESLEFLNREKIELAKLINHPALPHKKPFKERLSWISGEENRLAFSEENVRTSKKIKETDEKQRHPIQVDESDLQNLLCLIEDIYMEPNQIPPQLMIRNFQLKKKETPLHNQLFEIEMELLKREWINK